MQPFIVLSLALATFVAARPAVEHDSLQLRASPIAETPAPARRVSR